MMKPMVFTMVFIIAIFSWMAGSVESFRVGFVSLPWDPMWSFNARVLWIFPAWIATYIAMSAPLGRILDRHIKIVRFSRHPCTVGETIPEPLLHMLDDAKESQHHLQLKITEEVKDQGKQGGSKNIDQRRSGNKHVAPPRRFKVQDLQFRMISRTPKGSSGATCVEASGDDHFAKGDDQRPPRKWDIDAGGQDCRIRGWRSMNGGDVFREEARSRGLSVEELSAEAKKDTHVDRHLDELLRNACHPQNLPRLWRADSVAGGHIRTILNA